VGLCGGHQRALGAVVLLLAPPGGHAGERLTARTQERTPFFPEELPELIAEEARELWI
jgi:hypothetical protein